MSHRLFLCGRCRKLVELCSRCDRGNHYCSPECAAAQRRDSVRRAAKEVVPISGETVKKEGGSDSLMLAHTSSPERSRPHESEVPEEAPAFQQKADPAA